MTSRRRPPFPAALVAASLAICALPGAATACQWSAPARDELVLRGNPECLSNPAVREAFTQQLRESVAMSEFVAGGSGFPGASSRGGGPRRSALNGRSLEAHPLATFGALRAYEAQMVGKRYWGQRMDTTQY